MQPDHFRDIPTAEIVEPWIVLRTVNRSTVEYMELRDSLRDKGFFNSICVRPSSRQPGKMEVVDGLYRYTAACELRLPSIPCIVKFDLTDADVLAAQIQANALRPETTVLEFARQLRRIMDDKAGMTMAELSSRIHKNPEWISRQLSLLCLSPEAQRAVEQGKMAMSAAYVLARVPSYFRQRYLALALTMPASDFVPLATAAMRQHRENVRHGRWSGQVHEVFTPVPYLRGLKEVLAEYRDRQVGGLRLAKAKCTDPVEAWYLALQWAAHMDDDSVEEQRQRVLQQQQQATVNRCHRGEGEEDAM